MVEGVFSFLLKTQVLSEGYVFQEFLFLDSQIGG